MDCKTCFSKYTKMLYFDDISISKKQTYQQISIILLIQIYSMLVNSFKYIFKAFVQNRNHEYAENHGNNPQPLRLPRDMVQKLSFTNFHSFLRKNDLF